MTRNQAMRRDDMVGGRNDDHGQYGRSEEWDGQGYDLRPGHHYGQQDDGEQEYDPRAYAPNPEEPYGYDDDGNPIYYEPEPRKLAANRSGMLMLGGLLALVVVGGAGAVGYRMISHGSLSGEPPLIKADTEPVKTIPKSAGNDAPAQNKAVYDRVDPSAPKSKVLSREEEPVDLPSAPSSEPRNADASRIILPGGTASADTVAPGTNGSEPRKVKTVAIRPNPPAAQPAPQTPQSTAAADPIGETARTGQAPKSDFDNGIMSGDNTPLRTDEPKLAATPKPAPAAPKPQAQPPVPTSQSRTVTTTPVRPQSAPAQTQTPSQNRADPAQVAAVQPRAQAPSPTTPPAGGFVVQVTSQRSEADARAAYANLQKRFPQVLGPYKASIQTATVADRGTYYRVRVGPFSNGSDASTVCSNLRAAGGDCVVAKN